VLKRYLLVPGAESGKMQSFGFVDDGLKYLLHHAWIQLTGRGPRLALREHGFAVSRIAYALAVVLELQRGKCVFPALGEQPDNVAVDGVNRRAYVHEVTAPGG
jgi:hypothetical protein